MNKWSQKTKPVLNHTNETNGSGVEDAGQFF